MPSEKDYIWSYLHTNLGLNDLQSSVAMGFFEAESHNQSKRVEGDYAFHPDFATISNSAALDSYTQRLLNNYASNGKSVDTGAYIRDGHYYPGLGLCQWTGGRGQALFTYAANTGRSWTSLSTQLDYLNYELHTKYHTQLAALKQATTIEQGMAAFASFEHASIWNKKDTSETFSKMYETRYGYAVTIMSEMTGIPLADLSEMGLLDEFFGDFGFSSSGGGLGINPALTKPLIVYAPPGVTDIDYASLSENKVMGVAFYGGDIRGNRYRSSSLDAQVAGCLENDFVFAMIVGVYATDEKSAKKECDQLYYTISRYPPGLGLWLELHTTSTEALDYYYKRCQYWGLGNACGLYCSADILHEIEWEQNYKEKYFVWLISHFQTQSEFSLLDGSLTPDFFRVP